MQDFVIEALKMERILNSVSPLPSWEQDYANVRVKRIKDLAEQPGRIDAADTVVAEKLVRLIDEATKDKKYIHGDYNPPNVIADMNGMASTESIVKFVDPLINCDAPEANWRHFTLIPSLSDALARQYDKQSNIETNHQLMYKGLNRSRGSLRRPSNPTLSSPMP